MNIGIDIRTLMDAQYSGVSEYTYNLVKEILKLDQHNQYKLFYNSYKDISARIPDFRQENVEIVHSNYPNKIYNYLMHKIMHYPKVDQQFGFNLFFMPHINFISLTSGCNSILTIHDLSFLRYKEYFSLRKNIWHQFINIKKLVKKFNLIIAVSESTKNDLVELCNINPEKIRVIYSGISEQFRKIVINDIKLLEVKKKYNLPEKFIFYLSTLEPRKNVESIIQAYNELRNKNKNLADMKLVLAGAKGWKANNIFKIWEQSKYQEDIIFLGYVKGDDKVYFYNLASLFVYPSFYEGFGFPPLEAMACGTPVVTSSVSSLPEVVGDSAIMVDPYNINDIATAMEQVLTNQDLANLLIKKSLEQARQFSWQKSAREYLEVFKSFD